MFYNSFHDNEVGNCLLPIILAMQNLSISLWLERQESKKKSHKSLSYLTITIQYDTSVTLLIVANHITNLQNTQDVTSVSCNSVDNMIHWMWWNMEHKT